jgi:hypothetical protein
MPFSLRDSFKRDERIRAAYAHRKWGISPPVIPDDGYSAAAHELWGILGARFTLQQCEEALKPPDRRGGSHKNDWRCTNPSCRHRNNIKSFGCAKCKRPAPLNGRLTRDALEAKQKEHRITAILGKHGL